MQCVPSTELGCTAGLSTGPRGAHPHNTHTHLLSFFNQLPVKTTPPMLHESGTDLQLHSEDFTQSSHSAEANHQARSALTKLSLRIRAAESLCFSDLAETNKKKTRSCFYSKAAGGAELDHKRPYESSHT